jgi:formylglycine-generating enzyme required for sulfatase activity
MLSFLSIVFSSLLTLFGNIQQKTIPDAGLVSGMVKVPAGNYTLFFENKTGKTVRVKAFYLDVRAVTNAEFLEFVKANPQWAKSKVSKLYADAGYLKHWAADLNPGRNYAQIKNSPVTNVSWFAANAYCKWKGKRLPTTDEWEYAGSANIVNDPRPLEKIILDWYCKPTPQVLPSVCSGPKNKLNLYDMHGLIWEWVSDFNSTLMEGDSRSNSALNRDLFCASGSFGASNKEDYAAFMRFAFRGSLKAKYTVSNLGFRCAKDLN